MRDHTSPERTIRIPATPAPILTLAIACRLLKDSMVICHESERHLTLNAKTKTITSKSRIDMTSPNSSILLNKSMVTKHKVQGRHHLVQDPTMPTSKATTTKINASQMKIHTQIRVDSVAGVENKRLRSPAFPVLLLKILNSYGRLTQRSHLLRQ